MNPFEAYKLFNALKLHFTTGYDFQRYNGKTRADPATFDRRNDRYQFVKLSKQRDLLGYLLANFISDDCPTWAGDFNNEAARDRYDQYLSRIQSFEYNFDLEIRRLGQPFSENFKVKKGQHPQCLVAYRHHDLSIETLVALNSTLKFFPIWDKRIQDRTIWPAIKTRCLKYTPFFKYNQVKIKGIILDVLEESRAKYDAEMAPIHQHT